MKLTAGKASMRETGSREQQSHVIPIQRKSSLRWVLLSWVALSIDKDSINSTSATFRFHIVQTSVFYLPVPSPKLLMFLYVFRSAFSSLHILHISSTENPSALLHSCPCYPTNYISLKRHPCSSGGRHWKFFLTLAQRCLIPTSVINVSFCTI